MEVKEKITLKSEQSVIKRAYHAARLQQRSGAFLRQVSEGDYPQLEDVYKPRRLRGVGHLRLVIRKTVLLRKFQK